MIMTYDSFEKIMEHNISDTLFSNFKFLLKTTNISNNTLSHFKLLQNNKHILQTACLWKQTTWALEAYNGTIHRVVQWSSFNWHLWIFLFRLRLTMHIISFLTLNLKENQFFSHQRLHDTNLITIMYRTDKPIALEWHLALNKVPLKWYQRMFL